MSAWMNDAVPTHNGNGFAHVNDANPAAMMDPSAFMSNPPQFNPNQFANPQHAHQQQHQHHIAPSGLQNGPMRHASPAAFQPSNTPTQPPNPVYQPNSVIPSKRPRPREDSISGSPRQNVAMQPPSRSGTPQQNFSAGYQTGAPMSTQLPHLQPNGSANASPSPIMGNQMRQLSVPQRVATASPHPFSPSAQQFAAAPQTSPGPSEHGTPQPSAYMQNMSCRSKWASNKWASSKWASNKWASSKWVSSK
ncbi:hypothetical protein CDD82_4219 [Ophiocordyceps australis]|uniref:Uncharacterized protein n=1 Tax=Ophiocordyceps australis TaxID=1399860 RepID=A0A2C5YCY5_9HYPO|nr:hypothetical protein CDD82_4219 [Ophiocordyceps australis]